MTLLYPAEIDKRLRWPLGRSERLARRKQLPHVRLPDGEIRFEWQAVSALVRRIDASGTPGDGGAT